MLEFKQKNKAPLKILRGALKIKQILNIFRNYTEHLFYLLYHVQLILHHIQYHRLHALR